MLKGQKEKKTVILVGRNAFKSKEMVRLVCAARKSIASELGSKASQHADYIKLG